MALIGTCRSLYAILTETITANLKTVTKTLKLTLTLILTLMPTLTNLLFFGVKESKNNSLF